MKPAKGEKTAESPARAARQESHAIAAGNPPASAKTATEPTATIRSRREAAASAAGETGAGTAVTGAGKDAPAEKTAATARLPQTARKPRSNADLQ